FGHAKGAFTGAIRDQTGRVEAAEGGTLFLDEIGDLALEIQPKLMRFLQEGEIQPLGELRPVRVDVRVIAATNTDLERAVDDGRFRKDLFHRLNIIRINVPPLRERREEIPALAEFFLEGFATRSGKQGIRLAQTAVDALSEYDWPGNVRQLRNEIERLTAYASASDLIRSEDLSPEIHSVRTKVPRASQGYSAIAQNDGRTLVSAARNGARAQGAGDHSINGKPARLRDLTSALELRVITEALARNNNNLSRTAQELGVSRRGLRLKLAQLGIDRNAEASEPLAAD
ncbi:MAG TPA: sigma 54-interacting transcriptional regulator, partial [Blastocatellia bacterium]|nr:sigma 54-interacting transcriptional regulator [Blastocatellia bacterium]